MLMSPNRLNTYLISISLTNKNDACVSLRMAPTSLIVGAFFIKYDNYGKFKYTDSNSKINL